MKNGIFHGPRNLEDGIPYFRYGHFRTSGPPVFYLLEDADYEYPTDFRFANAH